MGNYASCALLGPNAKHNKSSLAAKVIFPGGEIKTFYEAVMAAELMLETPNCFLVNSKSLQLGRLVCPLSADEELEMGNVYVVFPKQRLNSVVNTFDMGALFLAAKCGSSARSKVYRDQVFSSIHQGSCSQVAPVSVPKFNLEDIVEFLSPEIKHKLSMSRSKKPLLETIVE